MLVLLTVLFVAWHLVTFTGLDGSAISFNASDVVSVRPSLPGYAKGTMIFTSTGSPFIVRESEDEVKKIIECECNARGK